MSKYGLNHSHWKSWAYLQGHTCLFVAELTLIKCSKRTSRIGVTCIVTMYAFLIMGYFTTVLPCSTQHLAYVVGRLLNVLD